MRLIMVIAAALLLAQCASAPDEPAPVRAIGGDQALVVIGVAKAASATEPAYQMAWRRLDDSGRFLAWDDDTVLIVRTNAGSTIQARGIPGEFEVARIAAGAYALDSVFAIVNDRRVTYFANGVIEGPERPSFIVRPGEAVFLGIWEVALDGAAPHARLWRMDEQDARAVLRVLSEDAPVAELALRDSETVQLACAPVRLNNQTRRQICGDPPP